MRPEYCDTRFKKRLSCDLSFRGHRYPGIILNLSQGGLYVQTNLGAKPGAVVDVHLKSRGVDPPIELQTSVVWKRVLRGLGHGGMGLQIRDAAQGYRGLITDIATQLGDDLGPEQVPTELANAEVDAPPETTPLPRTRYEVRMGLDGSPRSKTLTLAADSREEALVLASQSCGSGWILLELHEL